MAKSFHYKHTDWYGTKYYNKAGRLHRLGGPAISNRDEKLYYINGKLHRKDGPAIIQKRYKAWYRGGLLHRTDGPAVISHITIDNVDEEEYWVNGVQIEELCMFLMQGQIELDK